jgi:hypothetical protein
VARQGTALKLKPRRRGLRAHAINTALTSMGNCMSSAFSALMTVSSLGFFVPSNNHIALVVAMHNARLRICEPHFTHIAAQTCRNQLAVSLSVDTHWRV